MKFYKYPIINGGYFLTVIFIIDIFHLPIGDGVVNNIDQILARCCSEGEELAHTGKDCSQFNATKSFVSRELISVCYFSSEICCSKELRIEQCKMGVQVAREGSDCKIGGGGGAGGLGIIPGSNNNNNNNNEMDFFLNCCEACKIGLFIGTSNADDDCTLEPFSYGLPFDDSFNFCCQDVKTSGSFYLTERDEKDLCSKFDRLCSQICENTDDSYVCKCEPNFQLLEDKITCVPMKNQTIDQTGAGTGAGAGAGAGSQLGNLENDHNNNNNNEECPNGHTKDLNDNCVDINECETGESECNFETQICFNTPGSYKCLNILPPLQSPCPDGFRQNLKTEQCDDINECLEQLDNCNIGKKSELLCLNTRGAFLCQEKILEKCLHGFRYDAKQKQCQDIDECQELKPCKINFECFNTQGGYDCKPIKKFDLSKIGGQIPTPSSSSSTTTTTTTKKLQCSAGFKQYLNSCIDIDECAVDRFACDSNQVCTNLPGAFQCSCKTGFTLDKVTNACVDVNECQINNHDCLETQRCDNTIGSYTCIRLQSCGTGYTLNAGTANCDDDDECVLGTHNCIPPYECRNTKGSFRCEKQRSSHRYKTTPSSSAASSSAGPSPTASVPSPTTTASTTASTTATTTAGTAKTIYELYTQPNYRNQYQYPYQHMTIPTTVPSSQTHRNQNEYDHLRHPYVSSTVCGIGFERNSQGACADIDECYISNPCRRNQRCVNTNGSYRCQNLLACSGGYTSNDDGTQCIDINECETNEANCGPDQICRNKLGGYTCSCPVGHILNTQKRCEDINECEFYKDQVCPINTLCINTVGSYHCECKSGFKKQRAEDKVCIDIDECQEIKGLCGQRCINYWGSYRCACDSGYRLNLDNNRTCEDIDECEEHKTFNLCMGICDNTQGSYRCTCPEGYKLGGDNRSCKDIDECTTTNLCRGYNEICTNTRGSYRCNKIHCPADFIIDPDKLNRCKRLSIMCDRDDIECRMKPTSYTYNFITLVSNLSIPPQGRGLFSLKGQSFYENVDFDLKIVNIQGPSHIEKASVHYFSMQTLHNEALLSLMRGLEGPQDIELELSMTVFMNGQPSGSNIAKIFIYVSEFPY